MVNATGSRCHADDIPTSMAYRLLTTRLQNGSGTDPPLGARSTGGEGSPRAGRPDRLSLGRCRTHHDEGARAAKPHRGVKSDEWRRRTDRRMISPGLGRHGMRALSYIIAALGVGLVVLVGAPEVAQPLGAYAVAAPVDGPTPCPQCPSELPAATCAASVCTSATVAAHREPVGGAAGLPRFAEPPAPSASRSEWPEPPPPKDRAA